MRLTYASFLGFKNLLEQIVYKTNLKPAIFLNSTMTWNQLIIKQKSNKGHDKCPKIKMVIL